nr:hypothetical protein [uncultured bacterium]
MSIAPDLALAIADDQYPRYFTEKIWSWIPEIHRVRDAEGTPPDVLRSLVEVLAEAAAVERRSIDRLWEDTIVDYADDWAVSYIAGLVGARLPHALNRRGRRTAVGRAIANRRRAGTLPLLERLIFDVTGWTGAISEAFKRLARTTHALDPTLDPGSFGGTATPQGGTANLRSARVSELLDGPFDRYAHTIDVRCLRGRLGLYNVPKLNVFLYRQQAYEVVFPTPFALDDEHFAIDPSGRDVPLFRPDARDYHDVRDIEDARCPPMAEWRVEAPIPCRLLNDAAYLPVAETTPAALRPALAPLFGMLVNGTADYRRMFLRLVPGAPDFDAFAALAEAHVVETSAKPNLIPNALDLAVGGDPDADRLAFSRIIGADLRPWLAGGIPGEIIVAVDPLRGRCQSVDPVPAVERLFIRRAHYGMHIAVGAGTHERSAGLVDGAATLPAGGAPGLPGDAVALAVLPNSGEHQIEDSRTYELVTPELADVTELQLQAGPFERPYLRIEPDDGGDTFTITALAKLDPADPRTLTIDGLWFGITPEGLGPVPEPAPVVPARIVLDGIWDRVTLCNITLDPGGERARLDEAQATAIPAVTLEIAGVVSELRIDRCITGPILERSTAADPCSSGTVEIVDSIVHSIDPAVPAIDTRLGAVTIERSTILGDLVVNRLEASEALVVGILRVTDTQNSCFRFGAASQGSTGDETAPDFERPPKLYESHIFEDGVAPHFFASTRFGDPGYAQLSATAPGEIVRGAENGSEMGAASRTLNPIKFNDLKAAFEEFAPVSVVAQFIFET